MKKNDDSYVFRRSSECACVHACARVWNVVFCLYFLIVFIIYAKKKRKNLMVKQMQNFQQDLIWFAHRKGESPVSFSGTEYREREKTHIYFCYFVCVWDECLSRGRSTLDVRYSPSVEWTNLSVSEKWIFVFCLTSFLRACKCGFVGELMRIHADGIKENKRKKGLSSY